MKGRRGNGEFFKKRTFDTEEVWIYTSSHQLLKMANHKTENFRLYKKKGLITEDDVGGLYDYIVSEAVNLHGNPQFYIDNDTNFIEIHYTARRLLGVRHEPRITRNYIVWEILSDASGGASGLYSSKFDDYGESAMFQFNKIRFRGKPEFVLDFVKEMNWGNHIRSKLINNSCVEYNFNGIYESNSYKRKYEPTEQKATLLNKNELFQFNDTEIGQMLISPKIKFKEMFLNLAYSQPTRISENLDSIELIFENRVTSRISWDKSYWRHLGCDSWDNLVNPLWLKYKIRKELETDENFRYQIMPASRRHA